MQTIDKPNCFLCGLSGRILYEGERDRLFAAPGVWNIRICPNCELAWLDPCPLPDEVSNLYREYHTHRVVRKPNTTIGNIKYNTKRAVWAAWLGYRRGIGRGLLFAGYIARFIPPLYEAGLLAVMGLSAEKRGRLIDVGCGNGQFLVLMRDLGWEVLGVEPDMEAARVAEEKFGLTVIPSTLEEAKLPDASADAITMHHVIEHVYNPISLLRECWRVLRPGGTLVIVTPNLSSLGRRLFGSSWRGWEVPRHLFVFSPKSLKTCVGLVGLRVRTIWTTARIARWVWAVSRTLQVKGRWSEVLWEELPRGLRLKGWTFQWLEHLVGGGEELVVIATK